MKQFTSFVILLTFLSSCALRNVQSIPSTPAQPVAASTSSPSVETLPEVGYPRFTTSDKPYLGCWKSVKRNEVVRFERTYFRFDDSTFQSKELSKSVQYKQIESNGNKDYFQIEVASKPPRILSINIVSDQEMTIGEFETAEEITEGESKNYWAVEKIDCKSFDRFMKR